MGDLSLTRSPRLLTTRLLFQASATASDAAAAAAASEARRALRIRKSTKRRESSSIPCHKAQNCEEHPSYASKRYLVLCPAQEAHCGQPTGRCAR